MSTATLVLAPGATLVFLLLHAGVARGGRGSFGVLLKISRGAAAMLLVALGAISLYSLWELWPQAFLVEHRSSSPLAAIVAVIIGHLVADLLWLAWGVRRGERARRDLVIHHALGLVVCAAALWLETGYALLAVGMTTELLPVTTGLGGLGTALGRSKLRIWSDRLGLAVIWLWRLPCWTFLGWRVTVTLTDPASPPLRLARWVTLAAVVAVVALDLYWSREYRESLLRRSGSAPPGP